MFLIIETATQRGLVALCNDSQVLATEEFPVGLGESGRLEPALDVLFQKLRAAPRDLEYVAVGIGPGSYTGIRVGVSASKALSFALQIPLVGISTLRAFVPPLEYEGE